MNLLRSLGGAAVAHSLILTAAYSLSLPGSAQNTYNRSTTRTRVEQGGGGHSRPPGSYTDGSLSPTVHDAQPSQLGLPPTIYSAGAGSPGDALSRGKRVENSPLPGAKTTGGLPATRQSRYLYGPGEGRASMQLPQRRRPRAQNQAASSSTNRPAQPVYSYSSYDSVDGNKPRRGARAF